MTDVKAIAKEVVKELKRGQSIVVTASDIALMCAYAPDSKPVRGHARRPDLPTLRFTRRRRHPPLPAQGRGKMDRAQVPRRKQACPADLSSIRSGRRNAA